MSYLSEFWKKHNYHDEAALTIPDGVTEIGRHAFENCVKLESVDIPDGVTKIEGYAFSCCENLKKVHLPDSVTEIGEAAFWGCSNLKEINIPDSVTKIGDEAFEGRCTDISVVITCHKGSYVDQYALKYGLNVDYTPEPPNDISVLREMLSEQQKQIEKMNELLTSLSNQMEEVIMKKQRGSEQIER